MILIVAATDHELRPWLEICAEDSGVASPSKLEPGAVLELDNEDPRVSILCTGVGAEVTRASCARIGELQPRLVLHVGLAGGLRAGINAGDLVMVTAVSQAIYDPGNGEVPAPRALPDHILNPLRSTLAELPDRMGQGAILTVSRFIDRAADKRALGMSSGYLACEMEAALVLEAAEEAGATYVGIRGISDTEDHDVPPPPPRGRPDQKLRGWLRLLSSPSDAVGMARMLRGSRRASEALSRAIPRALAVLEVHGRT